MKNGRCRLHGGATPRGRENANTKHGRYSSHLPTRAAAYYEQARNDPDLLSLNDDIALVDARIAEVIQGLQTAPPDWESLRDTLDAFTLALSREDLADANRQLAVMTRLVKMGMADAQIWDNVFTLQERRRKLVETQRKTLIDMQQMITADAAYLLINAILDILIRHVSDNQVRRRIAAEIDKLITD